MGRTSVPTSERQWMRRLTAAAKRKLVVGEDGKPELEPYEKGRKLDWMTVAADKVFELACEGNLLATEHIANRFDGKIKEQVEVTNNSNLQVRYETYEEARAALLEEGINIDRLPMLTDMHIPEGQDRS